MPPRTPTPDWPYYFCPNCRILSPIKADNGNRICLVCSYIFEKEEGGRVVLLTKKEAGLRKLSTVNKKGDLDES